MVDDEGGQRIAEVEKGSAQFGNDRRIKGGTRDIVGKSSDMSPSARNQFKFNLRISRRRCSWRKYYSRWL